MPQGREHAWAPGVAVQLQRRVCSGCAPSRQRRPAYPSRRLDPASSLPPPPSCSLPQRTPAWRARSSCRSCWGRPLRSGAPAHRAAPRAAPPPRPALPRAPFHASSFPPLKLFPAWRRGEGGSDAYGLAGVASRPALRCTLLLCRAAPLPCRYNAMYDRVENLIDAGVLDPAKVTRSGLTNACSIAGIMLTTQVGARCACCARWTRWACCVRWTRWALRWAGAAAGGHGRPCCVCWACAALGAAVLRAPGGACGGSPAGASSEQRIPVRVLPDAAAALFPACQAVMTEKKREPKQNLGAGKSGMPAGLTM